MSTLRFRDKVIYAVILTLVCISCNDEKKSSPDPVIVKPIEPQVMFDDFNYDASNDPDLISHHWDVRSGGGGPGPAGSTWSASNVSFSDDPDDIDNRLLMLTASIGNEAGSKPVHAEISTPFKYFTGTYAARVKFSNLPISGDDGARIVQTFFTISPYDETDPLYSELDFEYLSNGGWGIESHALWNTSWNSTTKNTSTQLAESFDGWNDLLVVVNQDKVTYYINGTLSATHSGIYYPRRKMAIDFNQWFIDTAGPASAYAEYIDWVYHAKDKVLTQEEVNLKIDDYRSKGVSFIDTVK